MFDQWASGIFPTLADFNAAYNKVSGSQSYTHMVLRLNGLHTEVVNPLMLTAGQMIVCIITVHRPPFQKISRSDTHRYGNMRNSGPILPN